MSEEELFVEDNVAYGSRNDAVCEANTVKLQAADIHVNSAEAIYKIDQIRPHEQLQQIGNSETVRNETSFSSKSFQRVCCVTVVLVLLLALLISLVTVVPVLLSQKSNFPAMKNTSDMLDTTWPTKPITIGNSHTDGTEDTDTSSDMLDTTWPATKPVTIGNYHTDGAEDTDTSSDMLDTTWPTTKPVTIANSHTDGTEGTDTPKGTPVPITSCTMLSKSSPSGYYSLLSSNGSRIRVYCDMNKTCGGITGGWMRVTSLNMRHASSKCPSSLCLLQTAPIHSCGRCNGSPTPFVSSQTYLAGVSYSHVCGRITAYQLGSPDAYSTLYNNRFDGISITYGSPEMFIWTFLAAYHGATCQCADPSNAKIIGLPPFIGDHYFCETLYATLIGNAYVFDLNPLWDGAGCSGVSECCSFNSPPWFHRKLQEPTMEPIVMTVRLDEPAHNEDLVIKVIDIYVQ